MYIAHLLSGGPRFLLLLSQIDCRNLVKGLLQVAFVDLRSSSPTFALLTPCMWGRSAPSLVLSRDIAQLGRVGESLQKSW